MIDLITGTASVFLQTNLFACGGCPGEDPTKAALRDLLEPGFLIFAVVAFLFSLLLAAKAFRRKK
jgi:hypothetical protein